ncbi:TetR/AcrR family transcriptional regulator [Agarivorans sp. 1_MG-2023]|uniref:TetR/AcrR family transcriptional regulator n=1 Tax=Agarivorans sp. 1_MG-2023 TaxID=3062634 RepID=UPI0026E4810F|nr:TetR/AcrR family transcriptional regulator [Agarivorans sp. 1_MG-2023]MDO6763085.1 TetR/AcrR family transcriptional regulator [Agarivorans sp. 1_MG-2023]
MASSKRDLLIDTAQNLFYQHGFKATGIDTILAESGVAKKTLYNHFASKEALIVACLNRRDQQLLTLLENNIERLAPTQQCEPELANIMAFFDALSHWINSDTFFGCMFINASAEYHDFDHPVHLACTEHKVLVIKLIEQQLGKLALTDRLATAKQLAILADGAIVGAHTTHDFESAIHAKSVARALLASQRQAA